MYEKAILRAVDVASLLNISLPTLYRWVRLGRLPAGFKYGPHSVGWERKTVEAWIAAHANPSSLTK